MKKSILIAMSVFLLFPSISVAHDDCEYMMEVLDEAMAEKPGLDEEIIVAESVRKLALELRENADKLHKSGKHEDALELLDAGVELLANET